MCFWIKRRFRVVGTISLVFTLKLWHPLSLKLFEILTEVLLSLLNVK